MNFGFTSVEKGWLHEDLQSILDTVWEQLDLFQMTDCPYKNSWKLGQGVLYRQICI